MIFFWNRREIYFGTSMKEFADVRSLLSLNKIKYTYRVVNPHGSHARGRLGIRVEVEYQYYLYVHEDDYEKAVAAIHRT